MNQKISELTAIVTTAAGDLFAIADVSENETKKITLTQLAVGLGVGTWKKETPTGVFDGSNVTYTLAQVPLANTFRLIVQGQEWTEGVDYSIGGLSGKTLTLTSALPGGYTGAFIAHYQY